MSADSSDRVFGRLLAMHDDVQPTEFVLERPIVLGRTSTCDIIVHRPGVSRLHARIESNGTRYILHDADSVNRTFVNGQPINAPHLLKDRDLIGLGSADAILRFLDPDPTEIVADLLHYDERTMSFLLNEQPLELPPTQFRLLLHLYRQAGSLCTRESCAEAIWSRDYDPTLDTAALDRTVSNLRSALRVIDSENDMIHVRRGMGYMLKLLS